MLRWTRTAPRRWVAALGPLTVELLLAGGEVAAFVWRGAEIVGEVELGAARAGVLSAVHDPDPAARPTDRHRVAAKPLGTWPDS